MIYLGGCVGHEQGSVGVVIKCPEDNDIKKIGENGQEENQLKEDPSGR